MSAADKERRKQARDALRQAKQKRMSELARQARFRANNEMPQAQPATFSSRQATVRHGDSEAVRGHGLPAATVKGRGPLANEASMQQTLQSVGVDVVSSDESLLPPAIKGLRLLCSGGATCIPKMFTNPGLHSVQVLTSCSVRGATPKIRAFFPHHWWPP